MPNWCANKLWISGADEKYIDTILDHIKSDEEGAFDFNKVLPYPEEYAVRDREFNTLGYEKFKEEYGDADDGFNNGGYNWCIQNWGTKWNASDVEVARNYPRSVILGFSTAWSPPIPVIQKLSEEFPACVITLQYYECGMAYKGRVKFKGGETLVEVEGSYRGPQGG